MGRFRREMYEEYTKQHSGEYTNDESYNAAYQKVKKIKGFYSHLKVYVIVNMIIIVSSLSRNHLGSGIDFSGLSEWHTYSTAFFWGIGLVAHGLSVFASEWFFNSDWEQKKIQKYMDRDATNKNKWE
ncbi:2TM domain-containing protein [Flavobacterium sp. YJ01]|uniref:2TM domain-containing protein n=1 Tax=unclassified Flavobacterium TaxID=196869 RepID=UPI0023E40926|nr:2TM domain-containing protein [Flavobacterium sp. YJ01]WET01642.1 2TM domain-containing protein [Flavobacterium sp. YJ01]